MRFREMLRFLNCRKQYRHDQLNLTVPMEQAIYYSRLPELLCTALQANVGCDTFIDMIVNEKVFLKEWFPLPEAWEQKRLQLMGVYSRLWEVLCTRKILQANLPIAVRVPVLDEIITWRVHLLLEQEDGTTEAMVIMNGETPYSAKARKTENLPENALELLLMKKAFSDTVGKVSLYYLSSKDDEKGVLAPFEGKPGKNIISATFVGSDEAELDERIKAAIERLDKSETDCGRCVYASFCKASPVYALSDEKTVRSPVSMSQEQKTVAEHNEGPMTVIAGPGSGKTAVLVQRLVNLINQGVPANTILLLTFTRKACNEISERVSALGVKELPIISTFHGFGYELMRKKKLRLASRMDRFELLLDCLKSKSIQGLSFGGDMYHSTYGLLPRLEKKVYSYKPLFDAGVTPIEIEMLRDSEGYLEFAEFYFAQMKERSLIDFEDQVRLVNDLFKSEGFLKKTANRFRFIMVDESQDLDEGQAKMVCQLASVHRNLMLFGDDDQSIYGFRKGSNRYLLEFSQTFGGPVLVLNTNYRSTSEIIAFSNKLIHHNLIRFPKEIVSFRSGIDPVVMDTASDMEIATVIANLIYIEGVPPEEIAVIARKRKILERFSSSLVECSIPVNPVKNFLISDGLFQSVLNFLALEQDPCDIALYAVLSSHYGLTDDVLRDKSSSVPLSEYLKEHSCMTALLQDQQALVKHDTPAKVILYLADKLFHLQSHPVMDTLLDLCDEAGVTNRAGLYRMMFQLVLCQEEIRSGVIVPDAVHLLTAHDSKGKEFQAVFVLSEGFEPSENEEEERRLYYVALTRAKQHLYLIGCQKGENTFLKEVI